MMKLVREHINEKFTEDSDPIRDLGIGAFYEITLYVMKRFFDDQFKKFLKKHHIKTKPVKQEEAIRRDSTNWYHFIGTKDNIEKLIKGYFIYLEPIEKNPNFKKINEKFTEDGDPIHDMNIGLGKLVNFDKMAKNTIRKYTTKGRIQWLKYLRSFDGKQLTGRFKSEGENVISIRIKDYSSFYLGTEISFVDNKDRNYEIDLDEIYYVL